MVAVYDDERDRRVVRFPHELRFLGAVLRSVPVREPEIADLHESLRIQQYPFHKSFRNVFSCA